MPNLKNPVLTVLRLGRARIVNVGWGKGQRVRYANNGYGSANLLKPEAYCALGAIDSPDSPCSERTFEVAVRILQDTLVDMGVPRNDWGGVSIAHWNDNPHRTKDDVIALFDKAIERASR